MNSSGAYNLEVTETQAGLFVMYVTLGKIAAVWLKYDPVFFTFNKLAFRNKLPCMHFCLHCSNNARCCRITFIYTIKRCTDLSSGEIVVRYYITSNQPSDGHCKKAADLCHKLLIIPTFHHLNPFLTSSPCTTYSTAFPYFSYVP